MKTTATSLMTHMTPNPVSVDPHTSLDEALRIMERHGFRHLPVVENNLVVGMLSDRDLRLATSFLPARARLRDAEGNDVPGPERVGEVMSRGVHCLSWDASPSRAAQDMVRLQIGAIPVVEPHGILGIVTETNFLQAYAELCRLNDGACDDLVRYHMHEPLVCVGRHTSVEDALEAMDNRAGHLGVQEGGKLVGFLSQRDLLLGLAREMIEDAKAENEGHLSEGPTDVGGLMSSQVLTVGPGDGLCRCAHTMLRHRVSALPVLEDEEPIALLTQRDVLEYYAGLTRE